MKKNDIRRKKLRELIDLRAGGRIVTFAKMINKHPSYVSSMLYSEEKIGAKNIGERMVDHITKTLCLPYGWMDNEESSYTGSGFERKAISALEILTSTNNGVIIGSDLKEIVSIIQYTDEQYLSMFRTKEAQQIKIINIKGDSMSNTLEPGDLIFVDISVDYFDGDGIYIFIFNEYLYIKRLQMMASKIIVHSDNPHYSDWEIINDTETMKKLIITGKVLFRQPQELTRLG